jgi:hypothetical protein
VLFSISKIKLAFGGITPPAPLPFSISSEAGRKIIALSP